MAPTPTTESEVPATAPAVGRRIEHDALGPVEVPPGVYWGAATARALENFPLSGVPISTHRSLVVALAQVKLAAARVNRRLGVLDAEAAGPIEAACEEIISGALHEQFVVDVVQGGAGTSTNMNANEVIANRALELAGHARGSYDVIHPIDHVNRSQSTNDVYPTAVKLALRAQMAALTTVLADLADAFHRKGDEFADVLKVGRTQLQDAVPMTLGREFHAFGASIGNDRARLLEAMPLLEGVTLGGTAIGTGINADPRYRPLVVEELRAITGLPLRTAEDLVEATSDTGPFLSASGALKRSALKLSKIASDLRLLSSGPQAGFNEISLPARQPGSSIMPGKVNPVIPEAMNQVAYIVAGADTTVSMAAESGQLQLNAFEPVIAHSLLTALRLMTAAVVTLRERCVEGITVNAELGQRVAGSATLATALTPAIGYDAASRLAKHAVLTRRPIAELAVEQGMLSPDAVGRLLSLRALTEPDLEAVAHLAE
ncbi:aspartate ammonia-lyase [Leifsonia shinshuensis]|uniref:Aspartate ammonia-lyase n=1 Tax=Leifsonia shinshuensis TaxID=150026 RepID=A0A7G6YE53_9MICO|nr:aspartate ammonia-lyase [Leifsonia shinshuensis]QNE36768.1 aspartate ammonia-lyase [Leifsonia shinshuensis]